MKNNLVLSPIQKLFKNNCNNIILGKWYHEKIFKNNYQTSISKYNDYSISRKRNCLKYLEKKYNKKIIDFTNFMNSLHGVNEDKRFWEIIIGPFINRSLIIAWDRWDTLKNCIKNERISSVELGIYNFSKLIAKNHYELDLNYSNKYFNHYLYSEAFKILKNKNNIKFKYFRNTSAGIKKLNLKETFYIKKIFNKILEKFRKNQKYLFYNTYIPIKANLSLNYKLNNFPSFPHEFDKRLEYKKKINFKIRKTNPFKKRSDDEFDKFYNHIILKIMPSSYIENFQLIKNYVYKINLDPKIIFTAVAHLSNDIFKIWSAEKMKKGSKLVISDHGGNLEQERDFFSHKIYHRHIQWVKSNNNKVVQLPPNIFLGGKKKNISKLNKILIILTCADLFRSNIFDRNENDYDDFEILKKFIFNLNKEINKNIYFRVHPSSPFKDIIEKEISKNFGVEKIDRSIFDDIFTKYNLIIDTNIQTTYYQCLNSRVPVLLFYSQELINVTPLTKKIFLNMKKNKFIFSNTKNLKRHIEGIYDDPSGWWNSKKNLKMRADFSKNCSLNTKNDLNVWKKFFLKI